MSDIDTIRVVALLFPGVTQLDLTGPAQVFSAWPGIELDLAWHRIEPVATGSGFSILPTTTLADAAQGDILFVPGGAGVDAVMEDDEVLAFVRAQAAGARYVTSVCTGSFVLGAAGLLRGRRATSHWASLDLLAALGAVPVRQRVVRDEHVVTGAGVSSGIDFALSLTAELYGAQTARSVQLAIEYDPQPPHDAGSPTRPEADPQDVRRITGETVARRRPIVERVRERLELRD